MHHVKTYVKMIRLHQLIEFFGADRAYAKIYFEEQEIPFTTNELFDLTQNQDLEINSIAFENLNNETIFELQEAYNPDFNLIYENYED